MTDRTVKVKLLLDDDSYRGDLAKDAAVTRGFDDEITKLGVQAKSTGVQVKGAGQEIKGLGQEVGSTKDKVTGLGTESTKTTDKVKSLDAQIREAKATVRELGEEFVKTGDVDVFKKMRVAGDDVKSLENLKTRIEELAKAAERTGTEVGKTWEEVKKVGENSYLTSRRMADLTKEIDLTAAATRELSAAWARTHDADISPMLRDQQGYLRSLRAEYARLKSDAESGGGAGGGLLGKLFPSIANEAIPELGREGLKAGEMFGSEMGQGIMGSLKTVGAAVGPVLGPILAVSIAASIGAAISGAVLTGAGLGAIGLGVAAQFQNPAVKAAGTDLVTWLKGELESASSSFATPLINGIGYLKRDLTPVFAELHADFASLAPYVSSLLDGIGGLAARAMPGFSKALAASGPLLEELARDLPVLGDDVSRFFEELSKGSEGGTEALHTLITGFGDLLVAVGTAARFLSDTFVGIVKVEDVFAGVMSKVPGLGEVWKPVKRQLDDTIASYDKTGQAASLATEQASKIAAIDFGRFGGVHFDETVAGISLRFQALNASIAEDIHQLGSWKQMMDRVNGAAIGVEQAQENVTLAVDTLTQSVIQNGKSLDIHSAKGVANRQVLVGWIQTANDAAQAAYDDAVANGRQATAVDEAKAAHDKAIGTLRETARQLGLNKDQTEALIRSLDRVPPSVQTSVFTPGLQAALSGAQTLESILRGLDGSVSRSSVVTTYYANHLDTNYAPRTGLNVARRWGGITQAADGLVSFGGAGVYSRPTYGIAEPETGGEGFVPRFGDYARSTSIIDQEARWYGGRFTPGGGSGAGAVRVSFDLGRADSEMARWFRSIVRVEGAGNVQLAFGS